ASRPVRFPRRPHGVQASLGRLAPQHGRRRARRAGHAAPAGTRPGRRPAPRLAHRVSARPAPVAPMLATLVDAPFHRPGWIWEEKYDGIRLIAVKDGRRVQLITRNDKDRTADFPEVVAALTALPAPTLVLDGEVVVFDAA